MKKIGIYGGTFDPIHHGHLILARDASEQLHLDKIIFVPASVSPFKKPPIASGEMRMAMLQAAIENDPALLVDDCELRRPPPSYSIETVSEIRERDKDTEIFWLIGEDNVESLPRWHRFDELKKLVHFVVLDRSAMPPKHSYETVRRKVDISSTEIRNRVADGESIRYLVPPSVEEIIRQRNIYRESK